VKLSAPVYRLKRAARDIARREDIPLHAALDRVAAGEGYPRWSLLADARQTLGAPEILARLDPGTMLLIAARPGQGKTRLGLAIATEAARTGRRGTFFSLEAAPGDLLRGLDAIGADRRAIDAGFAFDDSEEIGSRYIAARMETAPRGAVAVVDYLQLLDQRRDKPDLATQVLDLAAFARASGVIVVVLSQIDRGYDPAGGAPPDFADLRRADAFDAGCFDRACFLQDGLVRFVERAGT
jgi:replicative DNA helicase